MYKVLTIAGSDCSGGAGIQADIKTITAHKMYGMSVITALTAQNTTGVYDVMDVTSKLVSKQLDCVFTDIRPDSVKIGMVSSIDIINSIVKKISEYNAKNIVVDPVMISTSGSKLLSDDAIKSLTNSLLPIADVITPNIPEAECLCGFEIKSKEDMINSAVKISEKGIKNILIKGGHSKDSADDLFYSDGDINWFKARRINNTNTHGTGCTLSSAIACNLAKGMSIYDSISKAKEYITGALEDGLDLGNGNGPLNHCFAL
ncbi:bifunctional hydroxymethylpyrimidine kinase/phosphomethylpyrimidine kinase [Clostridiaceae bacterium M8S5]|nr:bifunctional hydroxymethylpyrimidine kinase/phosphomethylpyrimidine kinase [Clostridiaceae bacterium M8S5]